MKRFYLLSVLCVVMVCVVSSAAFGGFGMNPIFFADLCVSGSPQEIREALNSGVKWNELAWFTAVEQNPNVEVIRILLNDAKKNGVNLINRKDPTGETALSLAAGGNPNPAVIKFLIDSGADVHTRDRNKAGPVSHAKLSKNRVRPRRNEVINEVIRILLAAGADDENPWNF